MKKKGLFVRDVEICGDGVHLFVTSFVIADVELANDGTWMGPY